MINVAVKFAGFVGLSLAILPHRLDAVAPVHNRADIAVTEKKSDIGNKIKSARDGKPHSSRAEIFAIEVEQKLIQSMDTTILYLKKTADRMPRKSNDRLDVLERLLNLYLEQALYVANEEQRKYEDAWANWDTAGRKGAEPKLENSRSRGLMQRVVNEARTILGEYPRAKDADVITFDEGLAMQFLGEEKEAARVYTELIQKYPNSDKAGDAFFSLGDFYFDRNDFRNAMNNYKQALRFKRSKRYGWALFKLAWCYYNLNNYQQALTYWKMTVTVARMQQGQGIKLKEEALRDMVYGFAETRDVEGAIAYYRANGGESYIGSLLTLLADRLAYDGYTNEAIRTLKRFQAVEPYSPQGPDAQKTIISLYNDQNHKDQVIAELATFSKMYGASSAWAQHNAKDQKLILETQKGIKDQILYYAKLTHKQAMKDDNLKLYGYAEKMYALFLKEYPSAKEVAEVKFNIADIEYFSKNYRAAGQLYLEIALMGKDKAVIYDAKTGKPNNIHRQSSNWMLDSYLEDFEPELKVLIKSKPDFSKPAKPLTLKAKNFVKGCGYYEKWYPDDKKNIRNCDIYVGEVFYRSANKPEAMRYLWLVATRYPNEKEGSIAVEELIPLYKNDKKALLVAVDKLLAIQAYRKGDLGVKLAALKRDAEIEAIAKETDSLKRAKLYEAQAKKDPRAKDADKLWYNAAVDYLKAGAVPSAIAAYTVIVKSYPQSSQADESLLQIAKLYEKRFEFANASAFFMDYANRYPKAKEAGAALAKSCSLLVLVESERAVSVCTAFASHNPEAGQGFIEDLIRSYQRSQRYNQMVQLIDGSYLGKFKLSAGQRIIALYRVYQAYQGRGPGETAAQSIIRVFQESGGAVNGEALRYVGEIAFKSVNGEMARFQSIKLVGGSVQNLSNAIQQKAAALSKLEATYRQVLGTKDAFYGVAALYQIGNAYETLANDLDNPPSIQGATLEQVKKELEGQVKGLKNQARTNYQAAAETISKFLVYNEWSGKVMTALARISGSDLNFEDYVIAPDFVGGEVASGLASSVRTGGGAEGD